MKTRNFALSNRMSLDVVVIIFCLACGLLRAQEPVLLERQAPNANSSALVGNNDLPKKQFENNAASDRVANLPGAQVRFRNQLIRDRMRDYQGILEGEYRERIIKWDELFLTARQSGLTPVVQEIVGSADHIRKTRGLDATQLKSDPEFHQLLSKKVAETLDPARLKTELAAWAKDVEMVTRKRMIECFQQIIAEDLGRTFDESLSNQVIKAVRGIPVEMLVANADSSAKIEQAILASLPDSAISATTRRAISTTASVLVKDAAFVWAEGQAMPEVASLIAGAAGEISLVATEAALLKVNEEITPKPDPDLIRSGFERALRDWNSHNLDPRIESILSDFRRLVIEHVEDQARKQSVVLVQ